MVERHFFRARSCLSGVIINVFIIDQRPTSNDDKKVKVKRTFPIVPFRLSKTKSRMLYNSESNGGPFSKVVFKS